jgi:glyoxylase-like metal-dependent hydrolase (beta-lactamase superfamily II)
MPAQVTEGETMSRSPAFIVAAMIAAAVPAHAQAPQAPAPAQPGSPPAAQPAAPPFATRKVDGTDNVYIFRYGGHQSMFVVTPQGVIATDPIGYQRPQAVTTYIDEIKKVTDKPIRYVIYSHHHYDHIAGGKPFKDLGARFVAHKNARAHLATLKYPDIVMPDETVDQKKSIRLGNTTLELLYVGRNHSDNTLVMRLPKEKIIFAVDFLPIQTLQWRNIPDNVSPVEYEDSLKKVLALDWERMIPGHPYAGGRLGTKKDVEDHLAYMQELSAEVKKAADAGKCMDTAMREIKLPKYESWGNYAQFLPGNIERYCYWWGRGF